MEPESSRTSEAGAGWGGSTGTFEERLPSRTRRLSWFNPRLWWSSRQEVRAKLGLGDISDPRRAAWVAPLTEPGAFDIDVAVDAEHFAFVVLCDTGEGDRSQYAVVPPLLVEAAGDDTRPAAAFGVVAGDVIYPSGASADYADKFFRPYRDLDIPVFAVPGNHDWHDGLTGFMRHVCGRATPDDPARLPGEERITDHAQRSPYFRIRTPLLTLVAIDVGLRGRLDAEQGRWLEEVSAAPGPKVLLAGKPLVVDGAVDELPIAARPGGAASVWEVVVNPDHGYVATVAGDIHNYQHYRPARPDGIHHVVSGGGGAFTHGTHTIPVVVPRDGADITEERLHLYPLRCDSLAAFSGVLADRLHLRKLQIGPADAAAALSRRLHYVPDHARATTAPPTSRARIVDALLSQVGGRWFHRLWSPFLDWDDPPFFKQFLRIDVTPDEMQVRCVAATGTLEGERHPVVEDRFTIPLARGAGVHDASGA